ncbi:MAG: leucine-rich repeat protein [Bacteroidales bacterium]|nr:leucine-rich repeat protein [Bacteroidales bacterium]
MKKVFLFLASCLVTFAAGAKTVSVSNSDLEWEENTSGEMEARIVIGDIGCSDVTLNFTGGNASKVPCYRVAIIDNGDPEYDYWHELSDWNDILEVNSSGNGSTTISLTACGQTNRVIAFFIQLDKNPNIPQYTVSVQSDYSYWGTVTGGGTYDKGELVKITATPRDGYIFKEWSDGNTDNPRYLTVSSNINLTAYFEQPDFQYEINSDGRTVTLTKARYGIEVANIPSSVTIDGNTYTVTKIGAECFSEAYRPVPLTSVSIPNTVTSIGDGAFSYCKSLTSISIPNRITSIGEEAFLFCEGLASITIPNSVTSIGDRAFSNCESLTSISIPNSVTTIGEYAFNWCGSVTSLTIPNSVTSIGEWAFHFVNEMTNFCSLTSLTVGSDVDLTGAGIVFSCNGIRYMIIRKGEVSVWEIEDEILESLPCPIEIPNTVKLGNIVFTVTAIDEYAMGADFTSISLPNSITEIGEWAFAENNSMSAITIPSNVVSIKGAAFNECRNLTSITCLAKTPPALAAELEYESHDEILVAHTFYNDGENITVYVPAESLSAYKSAPVWKTLNIQPIPAENVSLSKDEVVVNVEKTTADFSMPANESANSYTLTIRNNGVTFCTLTFNANGQLTDIDFSTTKSYELKADVSAFKFTVTGLSEASDYRYSFKVLNASKAVLKEYVGSFTTKNADGTGGSTSGGGEGTLAIDNISPINTVAIVGNQILVNGEAPAFVVTVAGQKIANANLKAGVYFVVADGETVGVSVR